MIGVVFVQLLELVGGLGLILFRDSVRAACDQACSSKDEQQQ